MLGLDREPDSVLPLPEQFRFDAGTPALNLLATLGFRGSPAPVERLRSAARLRDWLRGNDLPAVPISEEDLPAVRALREAAFDVLSAVVDGGRPTASALALLGDWAARPVPGPGLEWRDGRPRLVPPVATRETVLSGLARELAELAVLAADDGAGLRRCSADNCTMLYLDRSRGRRRRWCSMARCGNSAKAARHRARIAEQP
jgi:predicted RNA-binding Zn ribbon-like protein